MGGDLARTGRGVLAPRPGGGQVALQTRVWRFLGQDQQHRVESLGLGSGERAVLSTRRHWLMPVRTIAPMGLILPAAGAVNVVLDFISQSLWWLQVVVWVGTGWHCLVIGYRILAWRADLLVVTDAGRLMRVFGVFDRHVFEHRLSEVKDVKLSSTLPGRVFGYDTLRLESDSRPDVDEVFRFVPQGDRVFAALHEHTLQTEWQRLVRQTRSQGEL